MRLRLAVWFLAISFSACGLRSGGAADTWAGESTVQTLEHKGRWESGYGATFYNVVGKLKNNGKSTVVYVKLRVEGLDEAGKVVARLRTKAPASRSSQRLRTRYSPSGASPSRSKPNRQQRPGRGRSGHELGGRQSGPGLSIPPFQTKRR